MQRNDVSTYIYDALAFLPFMGNVTTPGLSDLTLYDVLNTNGGSISVVNATAFDIQCGSLPGGINTAVTGLQDTTSWYFEFPNLNYLVGLDSTRKIVFSTHAHYYNPAT